MRTLDEDLIAHGVGKDFAYLADASLWATVPEFVYTLPRHKVQWPDWLLLAGWLLLAVWLAAHTAARTEAAR